MKFRIEHYILDDKGEPKLELDVVKWAKWYETADRKVGRDTVGKVTVSTVFLGLPHNFSGEGPPVLWETMIITEGKHINSPTDWDLVGRMPGSREQAEAMHASVVARTFPADAKRTQP